MGMILSCDLHWSSHWKLPLQQIGGVKKGGIIVRCLIRKAKPWHTFALNTLHYYWMRVFHIFVMSKKQIWSCSAHFEVFVISYVIFILFNIFFCEEISYLSIPDLSAIESLWLSSNLRKLVFVKSLSSPLLKKTEMQISGCWLPCWVAKVGWKPLAVLFFFCFIILFYGLFLCVVRMCSLWQITMSVLRICL